MAGDALPAGIIHDLPADLREAFQDVPKAAETWCDITPLARNTWSCWVEDARQAAPRAKRYTGEAIDGIAPGPFDLSARRQEASANKKPAGEPAG